MPQTEQVQMVDPIGTRARLQGFRPEGAAISGGPYRDRDAGAVSFASSRSPRAVGSENRTRAPESAPSGRFIDLDAAPLVVSEDGGVVTSVSRPVAENGVAAPVPVPERPAEAAAPADGAPEALTPPVMRRIILAATTSPNTAPAFGRAQPNIGGRGLCFGIGRFCQADGGLGDYLALCHAEEEAAFATHFGPGEDLPEASAEAVLAVTRSEMEEARMARVAGHDLWAPVWIARFKDAAKVQPFQDMQFRAAAERSLIPMLDLAEAHSLASARGLALMVERAILMGVEAARAFVTAALEGASGDAVTALAAAASRSELPGRAEDLAQSADLSDAPLALTQPEME